MQSPVYNIICEPNRSFCLPAYSIFRLKVRIEKQESFPYEDIKICLRTNLGQAETIRKQIITKVEEKFTHSFDFHDIEFQFDKNEEIYKLDFLLDEVGYFEWKVWACNANMAEPWDYWTPGFNNGISVFPAAYSKNNSIYCIFTRQFTESRYRESNIDKDIDEQVRMLENKGYTVIRPSGNFDELKKELPFIIKKLGMKIIHFLPINPVPHSYGRMGDYGSPYASIDFFAIDPLYARFSRYKTIEEQFIDLTSHIHYLGGKVLLDMAVNHTGWASKISAIHPDWQQRKPDGEFVSPGAWGTVWEDLVALNHSREDLWVHLAYMFRTWCSRGVDGFRLDAGYMIPLSTWQYIIAKVREVYPDCLFLLEGLGGPVETTKELLKSGLMNWAYSELFQNYTKEQLDGYLQFADNLSSEAGVLVHYAETHDNNRLAKSGKTYTLMRLSLSAFASSYGSWGFTNGVEWLATEKIDVHKCNSLNWGANDNLVDEISRINSVLSENPAFWKSGNLKVLRTDSKDVCMFYRQNPERNNYILVVINLNCSSKCSVKISLEELKIELPFKSEITANDLLTGNSYRIVEGNFTIQLIKGQTRVLRFEESENPFKLVLLNSEKRTLPEIETVYRIIRYYFRQENAGRIDKEKLLSSQIHFRELIDFVRENSIDDFLTDELETRIMSYSIDKYRHSIIWNFDKKHKDFIVEGNTWLIVSSDIPCEAFLDTIKVESVSGDDGLNWSIFSPANRHMRSMLSFHFIEKKEGKITRRWEKSAFPVYFLPDYKKLREEIRDFNLIFDNREIQKNWTCVILGNGRGSMLKTPLAPGKIHSKYDALLMINPSSDYPEDRIAVVKCSKDIIIARGKIYELDERDCISFIRYPIPSWKFHIRDADTSFILTKRMHLVRNENTTLIEYRCMEASEPFILQVAFYHEWRSFHEETKATKLEKEWIKPYRILKKDTGYEFMPYSGKLTVLAGSGEFAEQSHWYYNFPHSFEATRGQESSGDAYCPGHFLVEFAEGSKVEFSLSTEKEIKKSYFQKALINESKRQLSLYRKLPEKLKDDPVAKYLILALDQFIVKRDKGFTIIAGYPWFLDWGRDTLICIPGLLEVGFLKESAGIISEFASFTGKGIMPNTIFGKTAGNFDTSDAPLWLINAVRCYYEKTNQEQFLFKPLRDDGSTLLDILKEIIDNYILGTKNGIICDTETGLIFSPTHFTWMDTQYPAATPRQGYPVEIQGLWINALKFLSVILKDDNKKNKYRMLSEKAYDSLLKYYWLEEDGYFADCINSDIDRQFNPVETDKSLRPNQLILLYLNLIEKDKARRMLCKIKEELLVPGAVRTLSDKPLSKPVYIRDNSGNLLNDPWNLYRGRYEGDEDSSRKVSYHNGTAWLWLYPLFIEALASLEEDADSLQNALTYFAPSIALLREAAIGTLEEIRDGNYPHTARGCFAQAWSISEFLRVYLKLRLKEIASENAKNSDLASGEENLI
ncbi:MAG: glycogen debranching enzyme N-terminal domain-containing protein [Candidatus Coatesbacteria bacterium]|nr:glycogen debranching enzyme N-terminal domain-containing protein [Candidatus Coatesbacteria bacterium]